MKNLVEKFLRLALVIVGNYRAVLSMHANRRCILLVSRPFLASYLHFGKVIFKGSECQDILAADALLFKKVQHCNL
jgi:hypothetical protein